MGNVNVGFTGCTLAAIFIVIKYAWRFWRIVVSDRARNMRLCYQKAIHIGKLSTGGP